MRSDRARKKVSEPHLESVSFPFLSKFRERNAKRKETHVVDLDSEFHADLQQMGPFGLFGTFHTDLRGELFSRRRGGQGREGERAFQRWLKEISPSRMETVDDLVSETETLDSASGRMGRE